MDTITAILTGISREHLAQLPGGAWLHKEVVEPFERLHRTAAAEGVDLAIASGHRSFDRQLAIWNAKAAGDRPVYSEDGSCRLRVEELTSAQLVFAILRWSALPGSSRHHWGTDMDVWDPGAVSGDYHLQLTPDEYLGEGPFFRLNQWLESETVESLGFYRPYHKERGGVSPEPWHISYRPLAEEFSARFSLAALEALIRDSDILLKQAILDNLEEIHRRFIQCP